MRAAEGILDRGSGRRRATVWLVGACALLLGLCLPLVSAAHALAGGHRLAAGLDGRDRQPATHCHHSHPLGAIDREGESEPRPDTPAPHDDRSCSVCAHLSLVKRLGMPEADLSVQTAPLVVGRTAASPEAPAVDRRPGRDAAPRGPPAA